MLELSRQQKLADEAAMEAMTKRQESALAKARQEAQEAELEAAAAAAKEEALSRVREMKVWFDMIFLRLH
jgi:hypothetical protein